MRGQIPDSEVGRPAFVTRGDARDLFDLPCEHKRAVRSVTGEKHT